MTEQNATATLAATTRTLVGKQVKTLRLEGKIPAVVYGHKQESLAIVLDAREFSSVYKHAGSTSLISVVVDGHKPVKVLIQAVHVHPVKNIAIHADLYQVNMKEKLKANIPLEFSGVAPAVDVDGGIFMTIKDEVEVECLPENLVQHIEVDISHMTTLDSVIKVSDLHIPTGVTILDDADEVIASIAAPRSEEEMEALDAPVEVSLDHLKDEEPVAEGEEAATEPAEK
jgi:large subunit ribosomal protein L25